MMDSVTAVLGDAEAFGEPAELRDVTIEFKTAEKGNVVALDKVSLQLKRGEFLVFVGASGSGKTTALNVFADLVKPSSGSASVYGMKPESARERIGYMFARDALMPWRTALENVEFGMELRGIPKAERREKALQLLDMMRLGKYVGNYPAQLSQGQRQRVAIARTWATSPDVLLMDEPFSALDAQTREALQAEFLSIWAREKKSIIFVTHDLNEAVTLADRIIVFGNGRIVDEFSVDIERPRDILDITESPEAKEIYRKIRDLLH
ncbi:ABC transporter ATP-binding protein [Paraburkholderia sp. EG285A]|uniref:ABC transporter ATP-binding protein n=1 Tax=Paraburkholderia sp. EG285A TaxID=3237009 RepID=UPI0034D36208